MRYFCKWLLLSSTGAFFLVEKSKIFMDCAEGSTDAGRALFSQVHRTQSFPTVMEKRGNEWLELLESGRVDKVESSGITEVCQG